MTIHISTNYQYPIVAISALLIHFLLINLLYHQIYFILYWWMALAHKTTLLALIGQKSRQQITSAFIFLIGKQHFYMRVVMGFEPNEGFDQLCDAGGRVRHFGAHDGVDFIVFVVDFVLGELSPAEGFSSDELIGLLGIFCYELLVLCDIALQEWDVLRHICEYELAGAERDQSQPCNPCARTQLNDLFIFHQFSRNTPIILTHPQQKLFLQVESQHQSPIPDRTGMRVIQDLINNDSFLQYCESLFQHSLT